MVGFLVHQVPQMNVELAMFLTIGTSYDIAGMVFDLARHENVENNEKVVRRWSAPWQRKKNPRGFLILDLSFVWALDWPWILGG